MKTKNKSFEIWALHEKVGKGPWKLVSWYTPRVNDERDSMTAEEYTKRTAKAMTDRRRKYKAVRYTVAPRAKRVTKNNIHSICGPGCNIPPHRLMRVR